MDKFISVRQLPVIEEHLRSMAEEIDKKVTDALSLAVTKDTKTAVKKVRAELNKSFDELEEARKGVKKALDEPYNAFLAIYKECVTDKFKAADKGLKDKIESVETAEKAEKKLACKRYWDELAQSLHIDWFPFEASGIKVTLSASKSSLFDEICRTLYKVDSDCNMIASLEDAEEIMVEYKKCLNPSSAMNIVAARKKAVADEAKRAAEREEQRKAEEARAEEVRRVAHLEAPTQTKQVAEPEKILTLSFQVSGTKEKLKMLKAFLVENNYKFK